MEVFLIPVGAARYELYFEPGADEAIEDEEDGTWFRGLRRQFSEILREAENERHRRHHDVAEPVSQGWAGRTKRRILRWVVEQIAEQRLLWHLRRTASVDVQAPSDLDPAQAARIIREGLQRDADRHLRWLAVHAVGLAFAIVLIPIPGPNLIGYYFTFTVVSHFLSMRGARRGLRAVTWLVTPNPALAELRQALELGPPARERHVHDIAARLRLQHLATFFERVAVPTA
ncbi:MAG: hypothetical protein Q8L86_21290 [Vicinamibacterales bacterium]|nr:hypothetical protein [Vicinamibacterales bacterium]